MILIGLHNNNRIDKNNALSPQIETQSILLVQIQCGNIKMQSGVAYLRTKMPSKFSI